jgi:dihydroxyacetone kinase DhaKLM complex PTS-EIIA-like component DhaM
LGHAVGETFEDVDGVVDLLKKIVGVEVSIAISAGLEDDPGFPGKCKDE